MFEKFFKKEEPEHSEDQKEIEKIFDTTFDIETDVSESLDQLIMLQNFTEVDPRITPENFPTNEREHAFSAKIIGGVRDSLIEDVVDDFKKQGLRSATLYELLEFLPQCPEIVEKIYAIGSIWKDKNDNRFCVKIVKKDDKYSLLLEELGQEVLKGKKEYYAPWPSSFLAIKEMGETK